MLLYASPVPTPGGVLAPIGSLRPLSETARPGLKVDHAGSMFPGRPSTPDSGRSLSTPSPYANSRPGVVVVDQETSPV